VGAQFEKTNAFNKSYNLVNAVQGTPRGDLDNASLSYNVFSEWKLNLPAHFILTGGASLDFMEYSIVDNIPGSATHASGTGYKRFSPVFTPRLSLLKMLNDHISIYADVSAGYSPPPTGNIVNATIGQVNTSLKPERGVQYEIGTKGDLADHKLSYQLALFDFDIHDKIVTQQVPATGTQPAYSTFVNAGKQQNLGAELSISYAVVNDPKAGVSLLRPFVTYAYFRF